MSHTPGPWTVENDDSAIVIMDITENTICEFTVDHAEDVEFYAKVDSGVRPILLAEAQANARLFFFAPNMLELLRAYVAQDPCAPGDPRFRGAQVLIARVEGR